MRTTRWLAVGAAIGLVAACGGDDEGQGVFDVEESGGDSTTTAVTSTTAGPTTTAVATTTTTTVPPVFVPDATLLRDEFVPLEAGTYRVDTAGTPFSFTTDDPLFVPVNKNGWLALVHPESRGPDDRDILIMRITKLADPDEPIALFESRDDGWPADDVAGWLDNVSDEIVVSNVDETPLGGLPATRFDLELGETDCRLGVPCTDWASNRLFPSDELVPGSRYRAWVVEQSDQDPLMFVAAINRESDVDWFDTADALVSTVAFGEVGPNPVQDAAVGPAELPLLGGVRVELAGGGVVADAPIGRIAPDLLEGDSEFLANPLDADHNPLESTDALVAAMTDDGAQVTELDPTVVGGLDARVFDIGGRPGLPMLRLFPGANAGWFLPPRARMWVVEHPERGLLIITAEAFERPDEIFPIVLAWTEPIIDSLEFIDLG